MLAQGRVKYEVNGRGSTAGHLYMMGERDIRDNPGDILEMGYYSNVEYATREFLKRAIDRGMDVFTITTGAGERYEVRTINIESY